jgi:hypothetical protein
MNIPTPALTKEPRKTIADQFASNRLIIEETLDIAQSLRNALRNEPDPECVEDAAKIDCLEAEAEHQRCMLSELKKTVLNARQLIG